MNPEPAELVLHHSLVDYIQMAGWSAKPLVVAIFGLVALGIVLIKKKPAPSARWGFMVSAVLPFLIGITATVTGLINVFRTFSAKGFADQSRYYAALGEVTTPLVIGLFGSAFVMTLSVFVWMRGTKPAGQ